MAGDALLHFHGLVRIAISLGGPVFGERGRAEVGIKGLGVHYAPGGEKKDDGY